MTSRTTAVFGVFVAISVFASLSGVDRSVNAASWGLWNDPHGEIVKPVQRPVPEPPSAVTPQADISPAPAPATDRISEAAVPIVRPEAAPSTVETLPPVSAEGTDSLSGTTVVPVAPEAVVAVSSDKESVSPSSAVEPTRNDAAPPVAENPDSADARQPPETVLLTESGGDVNTAPHPPAVPQLSDAYIIGSGDVLDIAVWRDESLTKTVVVLPDGTLSFPLIGVVKADGRTVEQLKEEIRARLSEYVSDLTLSVEVRQANSMMIFVVGKVNSPGRHPISAPVNVLQALAMAGGVNPFAKKDDIKIFRQDEGKTVIYPFAYSEVSRGNRLEENIVLRRGDLIVVP